MGRRGSATGSLSTAEGRVVCPRCVRAATPWTRMRGLLGRRALPSGEGLLISPADAVHTAFMAFAIDVVFLDRDLRVLAVRDALGPFRLARAHGARHVLELGAGEAARAGIAVGQALSWTSAEAGRHARRATSTSGARKSQQSDRTAPEKPSYE